MNSTKSQHVIDSIVVLLNIVGARGNILLYWLTGFTKTTQITAIVIALDLIYYLFRFATRNSHKTISFPPAAIVVFLLLTLNIVNVSSDGGSIVLQSEYLTMIVLFSLILFRLSREYLLKDCSIKLVSRGYVWASMTSIIGVFLSFVLLLLVGQMMKPINADFLTSNIEHGTTYYRSYFTVNASTLTLRMPFFQNFGILCGLFHEPHILAQNVFPCLILLLGFSKKTSTTWFAVISAVLIILFTGSATNITTTIICLSIFFAINTKKRFITTILGIASIVFAVLLFVSLDDTLLQFFLGRLDADNFSRQYSLALLKWTFSPHSLLGSDFFATEYVEEIMYSSTLSKDVGIIPFILNITFILLFVRNIIKLIKCNNGIAVSVAMASLYYILHSAKIGMTMFSQTLPILLIFLQTMALSKYGRIRTP